MQSAFDAVMAMRTPGAAPGIDLRRQRSDALAGLWSGPCQAMVVDYGSGAGDLKISRGIHDAQALSARLSVPRTLPVRWVHMDGLNFSMVQALGLAYELHPLAIEDVLHVPQRIKADWYDGALYLSLVHMHLGSSGAPHLRRGFSSRAVDPEEAEDSAGAAAGARLQRNSSMNRRLQRTNSIGLSLETAATGSGPAGGSGSEHVVPVATEQVSLFLLRGGVVLSIFQRDGARVTAPILTQLEEPRALVRECGDASMLFHLLLDAVVDHCYPVVDAFADRLHEHEHEVHSGQAQAASTRQLHRMQRDLLRIVRMLAPLQSVVERLIARAEREAFPMLPAHLLSTPSGSSSALVPSQPPAATNGAAPPPPSSPRAGTASASGGFNCGPLISPLTATYLGDVRDHSYTLSETICSLAAECKDLVDLIFNMTAHAQSQSTQALAVVSVIFLPISFVAGAYGTNFELIPLLHWDHGFAYFWALCGATTAVFLAALWRMGLLKST